MNASICRPVLLCMTWRGGVGVTGVCGSSSEGAQNITKTQKTSRLSRADGLCTTVCTSRGAERQEACWKRPTNMRLLFEDTASCRQELFVGCTASEFRMAYHGLTALKYVISMWEEWCFGALISFERGSSFIWERCVNAKQQ